VKINTADLEDKDFVNDVLARGKDIEVRAFALEQEILAVVESKI